ncbi:ROK family protein [Foetidibacter luteolus]|uniref:ROK family protein n=1 Tax=Foetidibacter luteolus TaxID=2608880 RepID=UPI00129B8B36|nr:ROK family protein [Foetidibacter luteolus]
MNTESFIGIEIGGTKLQMVLADASLNVKRRAAFAVNKTAGGQGIRQQITEGLHQLTGGEKIIAAGIGFGGPVNHATGLVSTSHQVSGWNNFNIKEWLEQLIKAPVYVDNDANIAALGEAVYGAGKNYQLVFYMTVGSGIGGGMVMDKKIYHGALPGEVEIGHVRLTKKGDTLESLCSGWAVDEKIKKAVKQHPKSILAGLCAGVSTGYARYLKAAIKEGDSDAKNIVEETADNIAFGLSHAVHLFHPEVIVIGGGLSLLGSLLSKAVSNAIPQYLMQSFLPAPVIKIATLKKDVVPVGALELAKSRYEAGRIKKKHTA